MARAPTGSEAKRQRQSGTASAISSSNPRLGAAGTRAVEAHARVRRSADRLREELENLTAPNGVPMELDPEDSMAVAVERVITTAKSTVSPPLGEGAMETVTAPQTPTKLGVTALRKPTGS